MKRESTLTGIVIKSIIPDTLISARIRDPYGAFQKTEKDFSSTGLFSESRESRMETLGKITAGVVHDFNNILVVI